MKWSDATSYSRKDTDRTPRAWLAKAGALRIVVTRHCHHDPDVWTLSCDPFFETRELKSKDIEKAKREALDLVDIELSAAFVEIRA